MQDLIIKYKDFGGEITERRISDFRPEGTDSIDAFCHMRNGRRTFKLASIICATNPETGELVDNVWKAVGLAQAEDGRERLNSITAYALPAIKALKFFSLQTRGFAKRERTHIVRFIQQHTSCTEYDEDEIEEWLYKLWCGDIQAYHDGNTSEYDGLLRAIHHGLKSPCRAVALAISRGSGRKPVPNRATRAGSVVQTGSN